MPQKVPPAVRKILKDQPGLTWSTSDKNSISLESAICAILNYADFPEVKTLLKAVGIKKVKKIFEKQITGRNNYDDLVKHYFKLYFKKHA